MKLQKFFFISTLTLFFSLLFINPVNAETEIPVIGVMKDTDSVLSLLNAQGEQVGQTSLGGVAILRDQHALPIELNANSVGVEWIYYNQGTVHIQNQSKTSDLDSFSAFSQTDQTVLTVADLLSDYAGPEIALCQSYAAIPQLLIYAYSADTGATLVNTIYPWGPNRNKERGCAGIAIGNVDTDTEPEIVVTKGNSKKVRILSNTGVQEGEFLTPRYHFNYDINDISLGDFDGSGIKKIVMNYGSGGSYIDFGIFSTTGEKLVALPWWNVFLSDKKIEIFNVADVTGDGKDDIIVQATNKKGRIYILDGEGNIQAEFSSYPSENRRRQNNMFVAPFSY